GGASIITFIQPMKSEIDDHDAVLFHYSHQEEEPDDGIEREGRAEQPESHQTAYNRWEKSGKNRDRMDIAFVENAQNHVHDEERGDDEEGQRREELLQDQAFTLHFAFHGRRQNF